MNINSKDTIIFEIKPKYYFVNTLTHILILIFSIIILFVSISYIFQTLPLVGYLLWCIFWCFIIYFNFIILFSKVSFYITNQGIGFERRHWFRTQKKFFRFGEVEVSIGEYQVFALLNHNEIFIAPFNSKGWHRRKSIYRLHFLNSDLSQDKEVYEMWEFIRKQSKIALESQGIDIKSFDLKNYFICFIKE